MRLVTIIVFIGLLLLPSCNQSTSNEKPAAAGLPAATTSSSLPSVDGNAMKAHIQKLASDEMEGRAPGGKGEELATAYISDFYKSIGLKTQMQAVPMVGITGTPTPMKLDGKG